MFKYLARTYLINQLQAEIQLFDPNDPKVRDLEEWNCSIYEKSIYGDEKVRKCLQEKQNKPSFFTGLDQTTTTEAVQYEEDNSDGGEESAEDEIQFCFQEPDRLQ